MSGHTVLLVEDNQDVRESMVALLQLSRFQVAEASDGGEALALLGAGLKPCVILLDLMMPGVDGYRFREEQLQIPELAKIPVVIISGAGRLDERAAELGVRDFLSKPMDVTRFLEIVSHHCGHHR